MTKHIDANRLKAEIERRIDDFRKRGFDVYANEFASLLDFLDSLQQEQPEVDLDEEMDRFFEEMSIQEHENIFEDTYQMIARHFYELGLNARKEE